MKKAVVNQSACDSISIVVTLGDSGECGSANEVGQYDDAHVDYVYTVAIDVGEVKIRVLTSWSNVTADIVIEREATDRYKVVFTRVDDEAATQLLHLYGTVEAAQRYDRMRSPLGRDSAVSGVNGSDVLVKAARHDVRAFAMQACFSSARVENVESGTSLGMSTGGS